ncbi:MAG: hypothetical protein M1281_13300, partial [Chloroflexi bacterium]|nr:hypothetical protein [Chloroflexota bacterium]
MICRVGFPHTGMHAASSSTPTYPAAPLQNPFCVTCFARPVFLLHQIGDEHPADQRGAVGGLAE